MSPAHVERARASLAYVRSGPSANLYAPRWLEAIAHFEQFLAQRDPATPEPPKNLTPFLLGYLGLDRVGIIVRTGED